MGLDSEFNQASEAPDRPEQQISVLLTYVRMANDQLSEYATHQVSMERRLRQLEQQLSDNTTITSEVRDLLQAAKAGMKVLGWLGAVAKWCGGVAGACVAIYTAWYAATHGGDLPGGK